MIERLTREQMSRRYPNQWIGISNIKYDDDDTTLLEADVVLVGKTKEELKELQFSGTGVVGWGTFDDYSEDVTGAVGLQV